MNVFDDIKGVIIGLIKLFRTPLPIYLIVYKNDIKVVNIKNGKIASGKNQVFFSSDRLLIADLMKAEKLALELINQIVDLSDLKTRNLKIVCHPIDNVLAELSPTEKMIFNDFVCNIGGRFVYLIDDKNELSEIELKNKYA